MKALVTLAVAAVALTACAGTGKPICDDRNTTLEPNSKICSHRADGGKTMSNATTGRVISRPVQRRNSSVDAGGGSDNDDGGKSTKRGHRHQKGEGHRSHGKGKGKGHDND